LAEALNKPEFSLAELVDWLALDGPRDRALVRRVAMWCFEHADRLRWPAVADWRDLVVTLRATDRVKLVVTGARDGGPGAWTWEVAEAEFPSVAVAWSVEPVAEPASYAVLDTAVAGRQVLLPTGDVATVVVGALVDGREEVRVRMAAGQVATFAAADVEWR
jgi:hypothetical protein